MRRAFLCLVFSWFFFLLGVGASELVSKKGKIQGASHVNLRSGPGVQYPSRGILREGEEIFVQREDGDWLRVSTGDGKEGYIHKSLVQLLVEEGSKPTPTTVSGPDETKKEKKDLQPPADLKKRRGFFQTRPPEIIGELEGKSWEILWWVGGAVGIFILGWICGGNYYLRRERIRRSRLRF